MIAMFVTYAGDTNTPFDREHWINVDMPLVRECWGPYGLERVGGFFPEGDGIGLIAVAACVFRDKEAMEAALASPQTAEVMAERGVVHGRQAAAQPGGPPSRARPRSAMRSPWRPARCPPAPLAVAPATFAPENRRRPSA